MLRVALTGGIATGKSYVLERCRQLGVPCLDADDIAHGTMVAGSEGSRAIEERFGRQVMAPDGAVDRTKLGAIVFADAAARHDLEAIVHPAVYRAIAAALRGLEATGSRLAIVDVPLLYETGHAPDFDRVIATTCRIEQQIERLQARGLAEPEARQRIDAQLPSVEKAARADFVVDTSGSFEQTDRQIDDILGRLEVGERLPM